MKVLFITTDNYPKFGTTVNILKKLFFEGDLIDKIENITVLTLKSQYRQEDFEVINKVYVYRALSWANITKKDFFSNFPQLHWREIVSYFFVKIKEKITYFIVPNPLIRNENVRALCDKMQEIRGDEYDIIVPIFGNHDAVAAALKFLRKEQKLVLYQVDPCSTNWTRPKNEKKRALSFERKMYRDADMIITMKPIFEDIKSVIPQELQYKFKQLELPLVCKKKDYSKKVISGQRPICLFSGLIYLGVRDPSYTIDLFSTLIINKEVSLHFVGVEKEELPEKYRKLPVVCYGKVSMEKAQELMDGADFLVNIGNIMTNQIPSKIFEYISTGKPIINICKNYDCPTIPYLDKYPLNINLYEKESIKKQRNKLENFILQNYGRRVSNEDVVALYEECTPEFCGKQIMSIFNDLMHQ